MGNRVKWKVSTMLEGVIKDLLNDIITKTPLPSPLGPLSPGGIDVMKMLS